MHQPLTPAAPPPDPVFAAFVREQQRLPASTYRLQLRSGFGFNEARAIVPYVASLGVTTVYSSPCFRARPGSTHGYDICDYNQLNPELGTEADFDAFATALKDHQLGLVLDFVPNHMASDPVLNPWWRDMLESGEASPYARFFDVDWGPVKPELKHKILLSFLGDHYGLVLERGELKLDLEQNALVLRYFDVHRPIDPRRYSDVLRLDVEVLQKELGEDNPHLLEFLSILTALDNLPDCSETAPERVAHRQREKKVAAERLARLLDAAPRIRRHIEEAVRKCNGQVGDPDSFDYLHELLERQAYRLAFWRTAAHEINYRRFFDINELAGLRMEEPAVFAATHGLVRRLIRESKITGLRLDHVDGLFDPLEYVARLQTAALEERAAAFVGAEPERAEQRGQLVAAAVGQPASLPAEGQEGQAGSLPYGAVPLYVVAEKILSGSEALPASWPLHGTTGYDFLNDLIRLFVDPQNARPMKRIYERFTDLTVPFADVVYTCKELVSDTALASELNVLAHALNRISEGNRRSRDFTLDALREALREVVACFAVYRTYISPGAIADTDRQMVELALARARHRNPAMDATVFDFLREALLPERGARITVDEHQRRLRFAMKFQQYTGPLQAKGVEDTAFYRYNVLLALNEVGGDPQRFGGSASLFHDANRRRLAQWPHTMLATATHDTKRGEDARARLAALSEIPEDWRRHVFVWGRINAGQRTAVAGGHAPDRNDEYLFYQALLGAWPAEPAGAAAAAAPRELIERLQQYMLKAVKEAKVHTSWITPNQAYDDAVAGFVEKSLSGPRAKRFLTAFLPFQQRLARLGMINSLAQVVLKIAAPGVPDIYQGTELWDLSLVDPDNRRPVDYELRQRTLSELAPWLDEQSPRPAEDQARMVRELLLSWPDGRIKMLLTAAGLRLRRRLKHVFLEGDYLPLEAEGGGAEHVVALARRHGSDVVIAVVPRFSSRLTTPEQPLPVREACWHTTNLVVPSEWAGRGFRNAFTGEQVQPWPHGGAAALSMAQVLSACPVALLTNTATPV